MPASTFDTLTAARKLEAAGFGTAQAAELATLLREAAVADHTDFATKADIARIEARLDGQRTEIRIVGAIALAIAAKLFGIFNAVAGVLS